MRINETLEEIHVHSVYMYLCIIVHMCIIIIMNMQRYCISYMTRQINIVTSRVTYNLINCVGKAAGCIIECPSSQLHFTKYSVKVSILTTFLYDCLQFRYCLKMSEQ